jgi:hypothetical protein
VKKSHQHIAALWREVCAGGGGGTLQYVLQRGGRLGIARRRWKTRQCRTTGTQFTTQFNCFTGTKALGTARRSWKARQCRTIGTQFTCFTRTKVLRLLDLLVQKVQILTQKATARIAPQSGTPMGEVGSGVGVGAGQVVV